VAGCGTRIPGRLVEAVDTGVEVKVFRSKDVGPMRDVDTSWHPYATWVHTEEAERAMNKMREPLSGGDQAIMDRLAEIYAGRLDLWPDECLLPVLTSTGFELTTGIPMECDLKDSKLVAADGGLVDLLFVPVVTDVVFSMSSAVADSLYRRAAEHYPTINHRKLWFGESLQAGDDFRLRLRLVYYVPDAAPRAPDYVNSPALGNYPTRVFPRGYDRRFNERWCRRSVRCAAGDAPTMALLVPMDDLVGRDLSPDESTGGLPLIGDVRLRPPLAGCLDGVVEYGYAVAMYDPIGEHHCGYSRTWAGALKFAKESFSFDDACQVNKLPAISEMLRMQRPQVLAACRLAASIQRSAVGRSKSAKRRRMWQFRKEKSM